MREKNIIKFANFFVFVLNCTNCVDVYIESKLKVEINVSSTLLHNNELSTLLWRPWIPRMQYTAYFILHMLLFRL